MHHHRPSFSLLFIMRASSAKRDASGHALPSFSQAAILQKKRGVVVVVHTRRGQQTSEQKKKGRRGSKEQWTVSNGLRL